MLRSIKTIFTAFMMLAIVVSFTGCSMFDFFAIDSLLKPPKLTGEKSELQQAFESAVGTDIRLFTPLVGDNRGSYVIFDANADGNDEAVVFYSFNDNASVVHMHLLTQIDEKWESVDDLVGSGTDIYKVDFYNIDNSRMLEIGVVWSLDDSKKEKNLSVYRISSLEPSSEDALNSLATIQMADYSFCDVDGDNANELLYFYFGGASGVSARLIDYDGLENTFLPLSEVSLPFQFSSLVQLAYDKAGNDIRFYVDCKYSADEYFSEIIIYSRDNDALYIPTHNNKYISSLSRRYCEVFCSDFDRDGYLDIPVHVDYDASYVLSDTEENETSLDFVNWLSYSDGIFNSRGKYFMNYSDGYALRIDTIIDKYYIVYDDVNNIVQVRINDSADENNIIFSLSCNTGDSVSIIPDGLLGDKNKNEYNVVVSAKGEAYSFTENFIRSLIVDL